MAMIFVGGSRDVFELPEPAIARIGAMIGAEHGVLVGDAPGADAEAQSLLAGYGYEHVGVFHAGSQPRNNLGDWAAYHRPAPGGAQGYATVDRTRRHQDRHHLRAVEHWCWLQTVGRFPAGDGCPWPGRQSGRRG